LTKKTPPLRIGKGIEMIINISRASTFQECRKKAMYYSKDRIQAFRVADPLMLGGAYHAGLAHFFAHDDMASAVFVAEKFYRDAYEKQEEFILPEERPLIERHVVWLTNSLAEFAKHYKAGDIQVIQPEVEFTVPLPGTEHHDRFCHQLLYPSVPFEECDLSDPRCTQPHYFRGKTDAVVEWNGKLWLFEHKTEARTGDTYFIKFLLDFQPTGYIYGIQKSLGIRPAGFVLNIIKKPNAAFKGDPLTVIGFEREVYIRSDADLRRFESDLSALADDFEEAFFNPAKVYLNTKSCTNWGRKCDYHDICMSHGEYNQDQFAHRSEWDYVELEYYKILGLPEPPKPGLVQIT
jgi:hypothetical protein